MEDKYFQFEFESDQKREIATPIFLRKDSAATKIPIKAIWDTGATGTMISSATAKKAGLISSGVTQISGVHGAQSSKTYTVDIVFGNDFSIPHIKVAEASDMAGFDLLVGMDVIAKGIMLLDGTSGKLRVKFQYPAADKK